MNSITGIWVDGEPCSQLPLPDRGLDFGDGLFETLLLWRGRILFPDTHWQRLRAGLDALGFPDCIEQSREQLATVVKHLNQRGIARSALRLTVTRGAGPRGYAPPAQSRPRIVITATALPGETLVRADPAALCEAQIRWSTQPRLAGLKHLNRLEQVLAAGEARAAGCDEALMLDQGGSIVSVSAGNIFLVAGRQVLTPRLDQCGIAGTRRQLLLSQWAPALGLTVSEDRVTMAQLAAADEVFYSNSLLGLRPVSCLGELRWMNHPVCDALFNSYLEDAA